MATHWNANTQKMITDLGRGEHWSPGLVVNNPFWPYGDGEFLISCPGCPACDTDVLKDWQERHPGLSKQEIIDAYLAERRLAL